MSGDPTTGTAGVALVRGVGDTREVFVTRRPHDRDVLGGFHGFFVGSTAPADEKLPMLRGDRYHAPARSHWGCAARELFEEAGLLPLERGFVASWADSPAVPPPGASWSRLRERVRRQPEVLAEALRSAGLTIDTRVLTSVGDWPTPEWASLQTRTEFFVCTVDARFDTLPDRVDPTEHREGTWTPPARALEQWQSGRWFLSTPIRLIIEGLATESSSKHDLLPRGEARSRTQLETVEFVEGLRRAPLRTATLPPATHTNCYVVGRDDSFVIDPGSDIPDAHDLVAAILERPECEPRAVVLTHHHDDHTGAAPALKRRFDLEVWAHSDTRRRLDRPALVDRTLTDGDVIGSGHHSMEVLHTPGHAPGHLAFHHHAADVVVVGDLVASEGTILIDPDDGHMGRYLDSLERIDALEPRALLPGHGALVTDPHPLLQGYLRHRRHRESKVLEELRQADNPVHPADLVPYVYDDKPASVWPLATRSLESHLLHLEERGLARRHGETFAPSGTQESDGSSV